MSIACPQKMGKENKINRRRGHLTTLSIYFFFQKKGFRFPSLFGRPCCVNLQRRPKQIFFYSWCIFEVSVRFRFLVVKQESIYAWCTINISACASNTLKCTGKSQMSKLFELHSKITTECSRCKLMHSMKLIFKSNCLLLFFKNV